MSEPKIELVRRAMEAFDRRDLQALYELCHPDVEFDWSRRLLDGEVICGYENMQAFFEQMEELFAEISFEEEEIVALGDDVLVVSRGHFRGRGSGVDVYARAANLWTVRDGKIARFRFYQTKEDALADIEEQASQAPPSSS
jgi:ketosteroid isomerase-like protein